MKEFFKNLAIAIIAILAIVLIDLWTVLFGILAGIPTAIVRIFVKAKSDKMWSWYKETIIWPYKLAGICNSWDEYVFWVRFNL